MLLLFTFVHILQEQHTEANSAADAEPSNCIMAHLDRILTRAKSCKYALFDLWAKYIHGRSWQLGF